MSEQLPPPSSEPEYLGSTVEPTGPASKRRSRQGVLVAGVVLGVAAIGAGGWGLAQLLADADDPASAVPATTVGYVAVDLDPSAAQKIEALRLAKRFPALAEELDLGVRDDLRRWIFEQVRPDRGCPVDYGRDVEPWLGNRMALAAVPDDDTPLAPVLVAEVTDPDAARDGVATLQACADGPRSALGTAFVGDYLLVTAEQDDADAFAAAAQAEPLADDPAYGRWMDELGEPGIVTGYAAADAPRLMAAAGGDATEGGLPGMTDGAGPDAMPGPLPDGLEDGVRKLWKDFEGAATALRFADGAVEAEVVGGGLPDGAAAEPTGPSIAELPGTTAAAFSVSLPEGWLDGYLDLMAQMMSAGETEQEFWDEAEAGTGLDLPGDIATLLGDGIGLSVDASADLDAASAPSGGLPRLPVALRISGDEQAIGEVLDKVLALAGPAAADVVTARGDGQVVVGLDAAYVESLRAGGGDLGAQEKLTRVVPEPDRASSALFVDLDAVQRWAEAGGDPAARANLAPLDALGASSWRDGEVQHGLLRITTD